MHSLTSNFILSTLSASRKNPSASPNSIKIDFFLELLTCPKARSRPGPIEFQGHVSFSFSSSSSSSSTASFSPSFLATLSEFSPFGMRGRVVEKRVMNDVWDETRTMNFVVLGMEEDRCYISIYTSSSSLTRPSEDFRLLILMERMSGMWMCGFVYVEWMRMFSQNVRTSPHHIPPIGLTESRMMRMDFFYFC